MPAQFSQHPLILFDGVCNLCNGAVNWLIDRDPQAVFRFASLQSAAAREALSANGYAAEIPDSIVLLDAAGVHFRSTAILRIAGRLSLPWSLLRLTKPIPRFLRDAVYAWIARHRYSWFGRQEHCRIPSPDLLSRFLDVD